MLVTILAISLLTSQPSAPNPKWEPVEDEPHITSLEATIKKDHKPYRKLTPAAIPIRVNPDRAILFYSAVAERKTNNFREWNPFESFFDFLVYQVEPSPENQRLLDVAKSLPSGWIVSHSEDAHIQLICVEEKKELAARMKVDRSECPTFVRLRGGVPFFTASASGWSEQHLMGMWKNALKPNRSISRCVQ